MKVTANFPSQCRFVLETLGEVYGNDAVGAGAGPVGGGAPRTSTRSTAGR